MSLLSSQLKELEEKTQEILYLQQELNEMNASLKVWNCYRVSNILGKELVKWLIYVACGGALVW